MHFLLNRLTKKRIWNKLYRQRLNEPLHLNFLSVFVFLFGSFEKKVAYDLVVRPYHAFGILEAAYQAKKYGNKRITLIEFGVASGTGLINMIEIAQQVTKKTGVEIDIFGFDTGKGMPQPIDYRDHPEYYNTGDFPMNRELLENKINDKATIIYGNVKETLKTFIVNRSSVSPIGFVSIDLDYYSSTIEALSLFAADASIFLPLTYLYFDDIHMSHHNDKCGELLAIKEFNSSNTYRNISHHSFLENQRVFRKANWIKHIYYLHVLDHDQRFNLSRVRDVHVLDNPYLNFDGNKK